VGSAGAGRRLLPAARFIRFRLFRLFRFKFLVTRLVVQQHLQQFVERVEFIHLFQLEFFKLLRIVVGKRVVGKRKRPSDQHGAHLRDGRAVRERTTERLHAHGDDPTRRRNSHEERRVLDAEPSSRLLPLLLQQFEQLSILVVEFEQFVVEQQLFFVE
jgi:hypothetical protein